MPLRPAWLILLVTIAAAGVIGGFVVLAGITDRPFGYFSQEPAETLRVPRSIGWQAHLSVLVLAFGAASALFAGYFVRRRRGAGPESAFLVGAGLLTTLLLLDDFLLLHESVYPTVLGIEEELIYPIYAVAALGVAWKWGRHVARAEVSLVALATAWLAVSLAADHFVARTWPYVHIVEDGAKMMGFCLWVVYLVRTSMRLALADPVGPVPVASDSAEANEAVPRSTVMSAASASVPTMPDARGGANRVEGDPGH